MELEFHLNIFYITRLYRNRVSKQGYGPKWFQEGGILLKILPERGKSLFLPRIELRLFFFSFYGFNLEPNIGNMFAYFLFVFIIYIGSYSY